MFSHVRQVGAVARIALLGLPSRARMSLAAIFGIALATLVLLGFLAMASGFRSTVAGAGSDQAAIILAEGSPSEFASAIDINRLAQLQNAPGIAHGPGGPLISPENFATISAVDDQGTEANLSLRGMATQGLAVRPLARLAAGRMFAPGSNELVVGASLAARYRDLKLGRSIRLAGMAWKVVGIFDAGGSAAESEVWADRTLVAQFFGSSGAVQSVRVRLANAGALLPLQRYLAAESASKLTARSEKDYFAVQARNMGKLILFIGWPLGIAMAIGALAGALNTMFTSVSARSEEIRTLRILGYRGLPVFLSTMAEAIVLVLIGCAAAISLSLAFLNGRSASTIGGNLSQVMFRFDLGVSDILQSVVVALVVAILGGALPAWRAARRPLAAAPGA
ncbi:ABC transporter permease [Sphingomonas sp. ABOLD]|uniref:Putative ABC transport system permease protein n=1 Tax=Sphingomonas trueperi TaxID=53317 RepID=A0A7X5XWW9_9SPHN|nr:ABC transporter permease [Sphingomonas trueperi]NJB95750.1 putative ABC transport system permease protein [Sphingomonas trueperi]RSV36157.1 ABC transporter permease [Sphingomonas sp. ABOLE]RSV49177.1 ABC transporter permease [Sphingomonas sp. ABOLD]